MTSQPPCFPAVILKSDKNWSRQSLGDTVSSDIYYYRLIVYLFAAVLFFYSILIRVWIMVRGAFVLPVFLAIR